MTIDWANIEPQQEKATRYQRSFLTTHKGRLGLTDSEISVMSKATAWKIIHDDRQKTIAEDKLEKLMNPSPPVDADPVIARIGPKGRIW